MEIIDHKDHRYPHFDKNGNKLGDLNIYGSREILNQVFETEEVGYYLEFWGQKIKIDSVRGYSPFNPYQCDLNRIDQKYT